MLSSIVLGGDKKFDDMAKANNKTSHVINLFNDIIIIK